MNIKKLYKMLYNYQHIRLNYYILEGSLVEDKNHFFIYIQPLEIQECV